MSDIYYRLPSRNEGLSDGGARLPDRERRFLGCLQVPLPAVYQSENIEGTFKLQVRSKGLTFPCPSSRIGNTCIHCSAQLHRPAF